MPITTAEAEHVLQAAKHKALEMGVKVAIAEDICLAWRSHVHT